MKTSFKYGVSAIALLAAISLAQAQTSERQGGGASGSEHSTGGRGGESGRSAQGEHGAQGERGAQGGGASHAEQGQGGGSMHHEGKSAEQGDHSGSQKGQSATEHEQGVTEKGKTAQQRGEGGTQREQSSEHNRNQEHGQQAEQGKGERSATERDTRDTRGEETRGRETELGGAHENERVGREGGGRERFATISREQRTRIHGILVGDTAIHRYHRADVDFPVQVGTRIPNTIEFYDAPARVVQIDPIFQGYKIVVLDDVILVIDPVTREIVDVIRT